MSRVVVIGLDGLPCSLLRRLIAEGVMPRLGGLVGEGDLAAMDTVYPPLSSVSWTTFFTGVNPGRHRIFGFFEAQLDDYGIWFQDLEDVKVPALWDYAQAHGRRTVCVNLPGTFPAQPLNGVMVSGFIAPDFQRSVYPKVLMQPLEKLGYLLDLPCNRVAEEPAMFWRALGQSLMAREKLLLSLLENEPCDLFIGVFTETDRVQHFYFDAIEEPSHPMRERVFGFYSHLDAIIGRLADRCAAEDELILLADHGFCRIEQDVHINHWLAENGYLMMKNGRPGASLREMDAGRSRAFALDPGRIFLNVRGRQPDGCVDPAEAEALREEIVAGLDEVRLRVPWQAEAINPFTRIMRREEVYEGPWIHQASDLIVHARDGLDLKGKLNHPGFGQLGNLNGMHTYGDAMLYVRGRKWPGAAPRIVDMAPTILRLMGLPVPPGLDGVPML